MRVEDKVILLLRSSRRPGFRGASPITMSGVFSHEIQETLLYFVVSLWRLVGLRSWKKCV